MQTHKHDKRYYNDDNIIRTHFCFNDKKINRNPTKYFVGIICATQFSIYVNVRSLCK